MNICLHSTSLHIKMQTDTHQQASFQGGSSASVNLDRPPPDCWLLQKWKAEKYFHPQIGPLQLEVTWYKIQNIGEQKNVSDSKTKHN